MTDRLLTARELGEALGLKPATILDHWERGEIPGFKFGRAVRFDLDEVLAHGRRGSDPGGEAPTTPTGHPTRALVSLPPTTPNKEKRHA